MLDLKRLSLFLMVLVLAFVTYSCSDNTTQTQIDLEPEFNHKAAPGDSAESFLQGDQYTALELEIDYMPGHQPTQDGLDSLETFLEKHLNKQSITFNPPTEIPSGGQDAYSASDIRNLEEDHRQSFTEKGSEVLKAYFLIVDGEFKEQSNVLGIAYWNTSMAFFGKTIEEVSSGAGAPPKYKIEGTVFRHEFGHNIGLVDIGTPMQQDHKTDGSAHCTEDGCLMEPSVETTNFFSNIFDGDIPDLLQFCKEDIQANGGR